MRRLLLILLLNLTILFGVGGLPLVALAMGCVCIVQGEIAPAQCFSVIGREECAAKGQYLAESKLRSVQCALYIDDACFRQNPIQLDPIAAPTRPGGADNMMPGGSGYAGPGTTLPPAQAPASASSGSVPPGFPAPKIIIPEINVKIPGLTNFVAPHPGACSSALSQLGITSCKVFPWIGQYVAAAYNFGVAIAAFLAVVMVMWGGFLYITASGISSQAEKGKTYVQGAFLGLVIVFTSYILLATINPDLVKFQGLTVPDVPPKGSVPPFISLPNATSEFEKGEDINVDSPTAATSTGAAPRRGTAPKPTDVASPATAVTPSGVPATADAALCPEAVYTQIVNDVTVNNAFCPRLPGANGTYAGVKAAVDQPNGRPTDRATPHMVAAIQQLINRINGDQTLAASIGQWQITEGWPETVPHISNCHLVGCAIDIKLLGAVTQDRITAMDQVVNQMKTSGTFCYVLNEYTHKVSSTTGGNFHLESYSCP